MVSETHEFQSGFFRRKSLRVASDEATEAARTAKAECRAEDVITVLEERGLAVSGAERERITSSDDSRELDKWLRRAITAGRASDLFAE